jgi:hypothetical protein
LEYSTYWGGDGNDRGNALDAVGENVFLVGVSLSTDLGASHLPNPGNGAWHETASAGEADGFIMRFNDGTDQITWGTLYGGPNGDGFNTISTGPGNQLFIAGETSSNSGMINAENNNIYSQPLMGLDFESDSMDPYLLVTTSSGQPVWTTYFGGTKTDKSWGVALSENELYMVGGTNSDQWTFPLHEFDDTEPMDWYDGNHDNNVSGTHGGLEYWGTFRRGFGTLENDDAATEPDGFICSFNITSNVAIEEAEGCRDLPSPQYRNEGVWFLPLGDPEFRNAKIQLFDVSGRLLPVRASSTPDGISVNLSGYSHGVYLLRIIDSNDEVHNYKLPSR